MFKLKYRSFKYLDLIILLITLDDVAFNTPFGNLSLSYIGTAILVFLLKDSKIRFNGIYNLSLLLLPIWFAYISTFQGSSILGNLSNLILTVFAAYLLPKSSIDIEVLASAIKKVFTLHTLLLIFDFFFDKPWGVGVDNQFFISFNTPDFFRASGLWGEPSFYCIGVNTLFLILLLLRKDGIQQCLLLVLTTAMSTSVSGVITSFTLIGYSYYLRNKSYLKILVKEKIIQRTMLRSILLITLALIPSSIYLANHEFSNRLTNPLQDNSILARTYGAYLYGQKSLQESPITGLGLGGESFKKSSYDDLSTWTMLGDTAVPISSVNSFVAILTMGGIVSVALYVLYLAAGMGKPSIAWVILILILFSSGKVFYSLVFLVPAIRKFSINKRKKSIN